LLLKAFRRPLVFLAIVAALALVLAAAPENFFTLDHLKGQQAALAARVAQTPVAAFGWGLLLYAGATALSLPGAAVLTLAAGAVFGLWWGTLLVSFASSLGASGAFLMARYLFRGQVQARLGQRLAPINRGIERDGAAYVLTLRLIPLFPFVLVNLLLALTPLRLRTFYLYSQLGMLPATVVYVNAGTQLAAIEQLGDVASPALLISFALLGALPFTAKACVKRLQLRRLHRRHPPPASFDRNVIVIGAGSAGLVAALIATSVRAKVTLIESERMGGDCLNTGCVPSKALLRAARQVHDARQAARLGLVATEIAFDFARVMERVQTVIATVAPHDSIERFTALGVECIQGQARLTSPYTVAVGARELSTRSIILATGAAPVVPPLPGLERVRYLTSDTLWSLRSLPRRLLVLGGGPIGCELAQAFARFGSAVTIVDMAPRLLPREDEDVAAFIATALTAEGITLALGQRAHAFEHDAESALRCVDAAGHDVRHAFDEVLIAVGRRPRVAGLGLEELGVPLAAGGGLELNPYLETALPSIYACGDLAGPYQFTHTASHQAWYATVNALFGGFKRFAVDYRVIPWCTFTDPEVARVGYSEAEARSAGVAYEVTRYDLADLDRAIADGVNRGFVKVLTPPGSDRILGATVVGDHAGDLIAEFVLAMKHRLGLNKILATIHVYPTLAEANKFAAGAWRRAHVSRRALGLLERWHRWQRGSRALKAPQ
jgi:pyruvate/2-oxoglutarate dehydrogenase complex dihydrolipoamide dehydrogenase (E3) component/uncharacterized membrane protein YdjX (TVP38/TMEM64 family)